VLNDTFSNGLLKGHVYTRPEKFEEIEVPEVLLSGNHSKIEDWNTLNSLIQTKLRRPDLLNKVKLTKKQKKLLEEWESKDIL
jgi:tRNA (guanine37-N1)-methyltransferase